MFSHKILTRETLAGIVAERMSWGLTVVLTTGCFDLLHPGHIHLLSRAAEMGDLLVVGINGDHGVTALKGNSRPIQTENARAEVMAALWMIDYVTIFQEPLPTRLISEVRPNVFVKGGDYESFQLPEAPYVESFGGKVVIVPRRGDSSTTQLVERMRAG